MIRRIVLLIVTLAALLAWAGTGRPAGAAPGGTVLRAIAPCRIVDTRQGGQGRLIAGAVRYYRAAASARTIAAQGGNAAGCPIPSSATALSVSVTAVTPTGTGYVQAGRSQGGGPAATIVNYPRHRSITNSGTVPVDVGGLRIVNRASTTHLVIDVQGIFVPAGSPAASGGARFVTVTPCRVADTRRFAVPMGPTETRVFSVAGTSGAIAGQGGTAGGCGVPIGASAVVASVTAVQARSFGYLRTWATGLVPPTATVLNYGPAPGTTNSVVVGISPASGEFSVANRGGTIHLTVDVLGYYVTSRSPEWTWGAEYLPSSPCRVLDTRGASAGRFEPGVTDYVQVAGTGAAFAEQGGRTNGCAVGLDAIAVEGSISAVTPAGAGFSRVWATGPYQQDPPNATVLNYRKGFAITNSAAMPLSSAYRYDLTLQNFGGPTHYAIDVWGAYVLAEAPFVRPFVYHDEKPPSPRDLR